MALVVSMFPKARFEAAQISLPEGLSFRFLESNSDEDIIEVCKGADCLLAPGTAVKINARLLENLTDLKLIQCPGAGIDHIDIQAAARLGIPVAHAPGQNLTSVAEFTIGLIIALQRQIVQADHEIKAGNYETFRNQILSVGISEIRDSRIGLIGLGSIGQHMAKLAGLLGASVSYYSRHRKSPDVEFQLHVHYKTLDEIFSTSDIISVHVPLNSQTRGLISRRELSLMPAGSLLINTARGEVVNQADLAEFLENGHLGGAAIDTLSPEPPGAEHPLLNLSPAAKNRLILAPHIGGVTKGALKRMMKVAFENMERAVRGEPILHVVNGVHHLHKEELLG